MAMREELVDELLQLPLIENPARDQHEVGQRPRSRIVGPSHMLAPVCALLRLFRATVTVRVGCGVRQDLQGVRLIIETGHYDPPGRVRFRMALSPQARRVVG